MLESTRRALTEPCPKCKAPAGKECKMGRRYEDTERVHWQRRDLFFIDSGVKKTAAQIKKFAPIPMYEGNRGNWRARA